MIGLQVQGVRSFDPKERQTVVFFKPLTVILGKNGAGKTTLIESLLHACAGKLPDGDRCTFVYDPKVAGSTQVHAQIRLVFHARAGCEMQVVRSFGVTQSRGKLTFQTSDTTLAVKDETTHDITHQTYKVKDADRMMPELLGVSQAVLEHVVFCHQEDCNWPLGPPAEVKRIFDSIFECTRYAAALLRLREQSKFYRDQQKDNETLLARLGECRERARQLQKEVESKESAVAEITARSKEVEPRLLQLQKAINALDDVATQSEKLSDEAAVLRGRVEEKRRGLQQCNLPPTKHTLEQLREMRDDFAPRMKRNEVDLGETETRMAQLEGQKRRSDSELQEARQILCNYEALEASHRRNVAELQRVVASVTPNFVAGEAALDDRALLRVEQQFQQKLQSAKDRRKAQSDEGKAALAKVTARRDDILRLMDADSQQRRMLEQHVDALEAKIAQRHKCLPPDGTVADVASLSKEVARLEKEAQDAHKEMQDSRASKQVAQLTAQYERKREHLQHLKEELKATRSLGELMARLSYIRQQHQEKAKEAEQQLAAAQQALKSAGLPTKGSLEEAERAAEQLRQSKIRMLAEGEIRCRDADRDLSLLQQRIKTTVEQLEMAESAVQQQRALCLSVLGSSNDSVIERFPQLLKDAEDASARAARKVSSMEAMHKCYDSFVASAKSDHICTVCGRGLNDHELGEMIRIAKEHQESTPAQLDAAKKAALAAEERLQRVRKAERVVGEIDGHKSTAAKLRATIDELKRQLPAQESLAADLAVRRNESKSQEVSANGVFSIAQRARVLHDEMAALAKELASLESKSRECSGTTKPIDTLQKEYDDELEAFEKLSQQIAEMQRRGVSERAAALDEQLAGKRAALNDAQRTQARTDDILQDVKELTKDKEDAKRTIGTLVARRTEHQAKIDALAAERETLEKQITTEEAKIASEIEELERKANVLANASRNVKQYLSEKQGDRLASSRTTVSGLEASVTAAASEVGELQSRAARIRRELDEQHRHFTDISSLLRLKETQSEIDADQQKLHDIEMKLGALHSERLAEVEVLIGAAAARLSHNKARDACRAKMNELEQVRAQHRGSIETLQRDVSERKSELAGDKYDKIEKRYNSTLIKCHTTEIVVSDLDKYYKALEKAVSAYHQEKITQINSIISELWRRTYRGSDIDLIQLRSEDDESSSVARRSYKYRVVMKRGNNELDMRARCSAGQKVLASVIIRMALSEAFCCDCGILALDEPTTNLDDDNARSLAEALRELLRARQGVKNFQLVVITHDESFVKALGAHAADPLYFITKDRDGAFSVVQERTFGDLFPLST